MADRCACNCCSSGVDRGMPRPTDTRLDALADSAYEQRKPHHHLSKQRRDTARSPILHLAPTATGQAIRPMPTMLLGLVRNHRPLNAPQELLRLRQGQAEVCDLTNTAGRAISIRSAFSERIASWSRSTATPTASNILQPVACPTGRMATSAIPPISGRSPTQRPKALILGAIEDAIMGEASTREQGMLASYT
jgi:hypothetical protein